MLNEKTLKMVNDTVEGIKETGADITAVDLAVDLIISDCYDWEKLEENEELKENLQRKIFKTITSDFKPLIKFYVNYDE
ncbi:MAG: hypothetical protein IJH34_03110 [Romboutsia sp.]|nr:hypothetical protein [Romboutsia sp.]